MRTRRWSLIAGLLLTVLVEIARGAEPVEIGTTIYVKSRDVQIRVEDRIVGTGADLQHTVKVRKVSGDWLWVWVEAKKVEGWIKRSDVCTASEAIPYFTDQIAANPKDVRAYQKRGTAWEELGNLDKALDDVTQMIRLRPDSAAAYNSRGLKWKTKGEYDIAIKDYDEAIRLDPKFSAAYLNRAVAWALKGELEKAIADHDEAIRLDPKDANVYIDRGLTWSNNGELDKALADYDEAIRLDPKHALAYSNRGLTWLRKQEYDKSIADYNEATRLDPKFVSPYNGRAWVYATCPNEKYRDGAKAVENATKACELSGWKVANNLSTLAAAYAEVGQFDKAVETQQKAKDLAIEKNKADYQKDLDLYKSGKPYRDEPKAK